MQMQLAGTINLEHGGNTVSLKPSLRAATMLVNLHEGFEALFAKLDQFDTATIRTVINAAATDAHQAAAYLKSIADVPISRLKASLNGPLIALCIAMIPTPPEDAKPTSENAKPMPWAEVYSRLYRIATGWLQWPPETAWNSTPNEIAQAFEGHTDMLKAIHGSPDEAATDTPEQRAENEANGLDPDFDRAGFNQLRNSVFTGAV